MVGRGLAEKVGNAAANVSHAPAELLQLCFYDLVVLSLDHFGDARLQRNQAAGNGIGHEVGAVHPVFASFTKIAPLVDRLKKSIDLTNELGREANTAAVPGDGE